MSKSESARACAREKEREREREREKERNLLLYDRHCRYNILKRIRYVAATHVTDTRRIAGAEFVIKANDTRRGSANEMPVAIKHTSEYRE